MENFYPIIRSNTAKTPRDNVDSSFQKEIFAEYNHENPF